MNSTNPLVSISCITYNHANYIRDALDGFLIQKTNFPFEILIHDDASTDGTTEIVREYEAKYPDIIKPLYEIENQWNKDIRGSAVFNFPRARGKYIALCEGDDYWTDPLKLQKQVDFLEDNPDYAACAHQTLVVYEDNNKDPHVFQKSVPKVIDLKDILVGRKFHTASVVFRTYICNKHSLPPNITAVDRALFFLIVYYGKIYFLEDVMACYRKSSSGISSWVTATLLEKDLEIVKWIVKIDPRFPKYKYLSFIHYTIFAYPKRVTLSKLIKHFLLYVFYSFAEFPYNIKPLIRLIRYDLPDIFKRSLNIP